MNDKLTNILLVFPGCPPAFTKKIKTPGIWKSFENYKLLKIWRLNIAMDFMMLNLVAKRIVLFNLSSALET